MDKTKQKKQFRELSDEELEKVTGGETCWGDDVDLCKIYGGKWDRINCTCNGATL